MAEYEVEGYGTSPRGQRVEFRTYPREGDSRAERRAHVVVSGRTVARGYSCDGVTYATFERAVKEGWTDA